MCGIVGFAGFAEAPWLARMSALVAHRGPDGAGAFHDQAAGVGLASRRLSIVDRAGGAQPMTDGAVTIVFNGEIFNAPSLRRELASRGHQFRSSHSDTEVLLRLYEDCGEAMVERLSGMFAFVLYDARRQRLFGARDQLGIKPLYYWQGVGRLAFASELKALLAVPGVPRELDEASLFHYMSLKYVPLERSILQGIRRLPPAHSFSYDLKAKILTLRRYWRLAFEPETGLSDDAWAERLREALRAAMRRWMMSDVPVGCALSGGVDSAAVVGLLAEVGAAPLRTYAIAVEGVPETFEELARARQVADRWGARHDERIVTPQELLAALPAMAWHMDEPYGGGLPSWFVFERMRQDVTVAMTGTGGDELFGSYGKYHLLETAPLWRFAHRLKEQAGDRVLGVRRLPALQPAGPASAFRAWYFHRAYYLADDVKRRSVFGAWAAEVPDSAALLETLYESAPAATVRDRIAHLDMTTQLAEEFLAVTDRFSMAHGVEARVPLLDHELTELVFRIPADQRTAPRDVKRLFKRSVVDLVPAEVLAAPKRGFVLPMGTWLRGPLRDLAESLLAPERLARQGWFRREFYDDIVAPHLSGAAEAGDQVWTALMFQLWHAAYLEGGVVEDADAAARA